MKPTDIERLRQDAIDQALAEERKREADQPKLNKKREKEADRRRLREERMVPFEFLVAKNRSLGARSQLLIDLHPQTKGPSDKASPWIKLGEADENGRACAIGRVRKIITRFDEKARQDASGHEHYYDFEVYVTSAEIAEDVMSGGSELYLPKPLSESTYDIRQRSPDKEMILRIARNCADAGVFNPISAYKRVREREIINTRLNNVEDTVVMFGQAVAAPTLNPHLATAGQSAALPPAS